MYSMWVNEGKVTKGSYKPKHTVTFQIPLIKAERMIERHMTLFSEGR